jgi:uncharacterized protein (TIGR02453 family)
MSEFTGFPRGCIPFLQRLRQNNHRDWFDQNRQSYETEVRQPALAFIQAMRPVLQRISPHFPAIAKKSGGSLMRVYRDTRFTKDKTPFKTNIGIQFRHELGRDVHAPGFYVHIEPGACFLGVGIWRPDPDTLAKLRDFIVDNPASWKAARNHESFCANYLLEGETLIRPPRGYPADHPLIDDLKRKEFIGCCLFDDAEIKDGSFSSFVEKRFKQAAPFMRYLCTALALRY